MNGQNVAIFKLGAANPNRETNSFSGGPNT